MFASLHGFQKALLGGGIVCIFALTFVIQAVAQMDVSEPTKITSFEQTSPVYTAEVEEGTSFEDVDLPTTLRAVVEMDASQLEEAEFTQVNPDEAVSAGAAEGSVDYGYEAPEGADELYAKGETVVYTLTYDDGSEVAYRVYGSWGESEAAWYACDEDGVITGAVVEIPVEWTGDYDGDVAGDYILQASLSGYTYAASYPYVVVTVQGEETSASVSAIDSLDSNSSAIVPLTDNAIDTVSTSAAGVNISLYDYDSSTINHEATSSRSKYLVFYGGNTGLTNSQNLSYWYNYWSSASDSAAFQGIVESMLSDGYPVLTDDIWLSTDDGDTHSLATLFGGVTDSAVTAFEGLDGLFTYDETTGTYSYDSDDNFATINPNGLSNPASYDDYFTVYGEANGTPGSSGAYFLPFDALSNSTYNYHFGMKITTEFMMPSGGVTNDAPMTFSFSGDDDVWVFIDDVLIMDIGGIHGKVSGDIDFSEGTVTYSQVYMVDGSTTASGVGTNVEYYVGDLLYEAYSELGDTAYIEENLYQGDDGHYYLRDYTTHSFAFFYMERGAGGSNCSISFNLATLQANSLTVQKDVTTSGSSAVSSYLGDMEYLMRLVGTDSDGDAVDFEGYTYTIYSTSTDAPIETGTLASDALFTLKDGQYAVFEDIPENVSYYVQELIDVDYYQQFANVLFGNLQGTNSGTLTIDGRNYYIVSSSAYSGSSANVVRIQNVVDEDMLSTLVLEKEASRGSTFSEDAEFGIYLEVDSEPVSGTYGGLEFTDGFATIKVGESFELPILTGSSFALYEVDGGSYYLVYSAEQSFVVLDGQGNPSGSYVSGTYALGEAVRTEGSGSITLQTGTAGDIDGTSFEAGVTRPTTAAGSITTVTLINSTYKFGIPLNLEKTLLGWNSQKGSYEFNFEVTGAERSTGGTSWVSTALPSSFSCIVPTITFDPEGNSVSSTTSDSLYIMIDGDVAGGTYYLMVRETTEPSYAYVSYDDSYYIVTIVVSGTGDAQTATVTNVQWYNSDGTEIDFTWQGAEEGVLSFTNTMYVDILKTDDTGAELAGAGFIVSRFEDDAEFHYLSYNDDGSVEWILDKSEAEVFTSGDDGSIRIDGLSLNTTYWIEEAKTPDGFQETDRRMVEIYWDNGAWVVTYVDPGTRQPIETSETSLIDEETGALVVVNYLDGVIEGIRWLDRNRDGIQDAEEFTADEDELAGLYAYLMWYDEDAGEYLYVEDEDGSYVAVETFLSGNDVSNTFTVSAAQFGFSDTSLTFAVTASASAGGSYSFSGIPSGTYAVRFELESDDVPIGKFDVSPREADTDEDLNSHGEGIYTTVEGVEQGEEYDEATIAELVEEDEDIGYWLTSAIIRDIALDRDTAVLDESEGIYKNSDNDVGLLIRPGSITLYKENEAGDELEGVEFLLEVLSEDGSEWAEYATGTTDENGEFVFDNLEPGTYRLTELNTVEGSSLLAESFEVVIPVTGNVEEADKDPSYMDGGDGYWLDVGYMIVNGDVFDLPMAGNRSETLYYIAAGMFCITVGSIAVTRVLAQRRERVRVLRRSIGL